MVSSWFLGGLSGYKVRTKTEVSGFLSWSRGQEFSSAGAFLSFRLFSDGNKVHFKVHGEDGFQFYWKPTSTLKAQFLYHDAKFDKNRPIHCFEKWPTLILKIGFGLFSSDLRKEILKCDPSSWCGPAWQETVSSSNSPGCCRDHTHTRTQILGPPKPPNTSSSMFIVADNILQWFQTPIKTFARKGWRG